MLSNLITVVGLALIVAGIGRLAGVSCAMLAAGAVLVVVGYRLASEGQ